MLRWTLCVLMVCAIGCTTTPAPSDDVEVKETKLEETPKEEPKKEATPREVILAQLGEGVAMLKGNQHKEFLERFIHPKDREKLGPRIEDPAFVEGFAKNKAAAILTIFEAALANKDEVVVAEDAMTATIKVPEGVDAPSKDMILGVVDGVWYIYN